MAVTVDHLKKHVQLKIEYLKELYLMMESERLSSGGAKDIWERIERVTDSIEKDLGINRSFSVGDMKVTLSVDDVQTIANGIIKKMREEAAKKWLKPSEGAGQNAFDTYA